MLPENNPADLLERIVERRRARLAAEGPLLSARGNADAAAAALSGPPLPFLPKGGVICEIKRRSPSRGAIAAIPDPAALAGAYRTDGAAGVSVLTEEDHFGGSLSDLAAVRRAHPSLPLLRKDFLLTPEDLEISRRFGADAVLLITRILDDAALAEIFDAAAGLGLTVLAEAHDMDDVRRLRPFAPPLVGINSRDLATFVIDPFGPAALAGAVDWPAVLVWESGIFGAEEARVATGCGFSAVLVGEGAVRDPGRIPEIAAALEESGTGSTGTVPFFWKELALRRAAGKRPLVKICGLTRRQDAEAAAAAGADILGFILAPSPRRVEARFILETAGAAAAALARDPGSPFGRALRTAVIVEKRDGVTDEGQIALARRLLADGAVHAVQLHGDAGPAEAAGLAFPWYKAVRPASPEEAVQAVRAAGDGGYRCPRILTDAFSPSLYGGTGTQADPEVLATMRSRSGRPLWLAGGITPDNVRGLLDRFHPELIDVSSGVESAPGIKDGGRIAALFAAVGRNYGT